MILYEPVKAATLVAAGTENNPLFAYDNAASDGTMSTGVGTEVEAASLAVTGTTNDSWIATPNAGVAALQLTLSSAQSLSFCAIVGHNIGAIGASVYLEYSTNGTTWVDCGCGPETPSDNQAIGFYFTAISAQYWRFRVSGAGSNDVYIAVAMYSNPLTLDQRIYQGYRPPITPTMVNLQSNVSEGGNLMGSAVVRTGSQINASFTHITDTFVRSSDWKAFQAHFNNGKGAFWAWRPYKYRDDEDLFWVWREGSVIAPENSGPKAYMSFELSARVYHDTRA